MSDVAAYRRIASLKRSEDFAGYVAKLGISLGFDQEVECGENAPLRRSYVCDEFQVGNRFCILPMEGWDGTLDGRPSELTHRRWRRFGESGAKLIWGGEAVAVRHDGRANPNQLWINDRTVAAFEELRRELVSAHVEKYGSGEDLLVGLQLTHAGRFARPNEFGVSEPRILYHHPLLDSKVGVKEDDPCLSDAEVERIIEAFVHAAVLAQKAGFAFVDIKHCHGYLGHEFLSSFFRNGRYGRSFENRTRFLKEVVEGIRGEAPGLLIGVRLSAFDMPPFRKMPDGSGEPEKFSGPYPYAFGASAQDPLSIDLAETFRYMAFLQELGIKLVCISVGSPYYTPHLTRPALFPPSDGYDPPEDPLAGVARQIEVTRRIKTRFPDLAIVGSGYSYLQEWLPNAAQYNVREGNVDFVGLGRVILIYHDLPHDVLNGVPLQAKRLCRTFSDCTTGPRNGLVSGCFPLDPFYRDHPHAEPLKEVKAKLVKVPVYVSKR